MYATGIIRAVSSFGVRSLETGCTGPTKIAFACGIGYPSVQARPQMLADRVGDDLAVRVVAILRHNGGPLRARDILKILQEAGTSFISDNPVYSVVGALKVARENGWVVKKGRGWWQAASRVPANPCTTADGGESVVRSEGSDGGGRHG